MLNDKLNLLEWETGKTFLTSYPRMIFIEFTRACNLYCSMCRPHRLCSKNLFMPQNILDKIEKELVPFAECIDVRGWGESTLDERLLPFIRKYSFLKKINLYSNLNTRSVKYWEELAEMPINIILSIESAIPERYALFRRGGNYQTLLKHLSVIKNKRAKLYLAATVTNDNIDDLFSLAELAKAFNAEFLQLSPLSRQNPKISTDYPIMGIDKHTSIKQNLERLLEYAMHEKISICVSANLETINSGGFNRCIHPWAYCFLRFDGKVGFCDHLLCKKFGFIGDLRETSFKQIWNSQYAQFVRKCHITNQLNLLAKRGIECDWCYQNRYANFEFMIYPNYTPLPLKDYINLIQG